MRLNDLISATDILAGNAEHREGERAARCRDRRPRPWIRGQVAPGFLFAALPGTQVDGRDFVPAALKAGAAALLLPEGSRISVPSEVAVLMAANPRRALALMAARFAGKQPKIVVAVTGTSGKTSTTRLRPPALDPARPSGRRASARSACSRRAYERGDR